MYTVLLGGYDALLPQPTSDDSSADFICFTDDDQLAADGWRTVLVEPRFPQDLHRSSRVYKILGHEALAEYDVTLCVDATVVLRRTPEEIVQDWLDEDVDMAFAAHSFRKSVAEEFDEVVRLNYDDKARVHEQLVDYSLAYPDVLAARPHWGGMIVRRKSEAVDAAMRLWFDHVLRYSRRDQLSLMVALLHGGARYRSIEIDNYDSPFHEWPIIRGRKVAMGKAAALPSGPLSAELRRALARAEELEAELTSLDLPTVEALQAQVAALQAEALVLEGRIEAGNRDRIQLAQVIDLVRTDAEMLQGALTEARGFRGAVGALSESLRAKLTRTDR
ncbi:glycosyltransferase domain-containing protein [Microbacterium sp. P07]|uniref:glycosyltransferase domain-containing protein n=1 Tax=Microbacterium sp. P07 TaxID=3366952 RepID=UPI0037474372